MQSKLLQICLIFLLTWVLNLGSPAWADDAPQTPAQIFQVQCAGCHAGGGNIVRRGKNLKLKTLTNRHLDTVEAISQLVTQGKGIMSAYGDRLTPAEITAVSTYVLEQAALDWKPPA